LKVLVRVRVIDRMAVQTRKTSLVLIEADYDYEHENAYG